MTSEEDNREVVFNTIRAAVDGDAKKFLSLGKELERRGWDDTGMLVLEALFTAVERLPCSDADAAAGLTTRMIERFEGTLNIMRPVAEAMIRDAGGEEGLVDGIPRNLGLLHSLVAVSQIVHEGHLSTEEAIENNCRLGIAGSLDQEQEGSMNMPQDTL